MLTGLTSRIDGLMLTELHMKRASPTGPANLEKVEFCYIVSDAPGRSGPVMVGKINFLDQWTPEIAELLGQLVRKMEEHVATNAPIFEPPAANLKEVELAPIIPWATKDSDPEDAA